MIDAANGARASRARLGVALALGGLVAWVGVVATDIWWPFLEAQLRRGEYEGDAPPLGQALGLTYVYALFGLPVAVLFCVLVGWPLFRGAERRNVRSVLSAVNTGAIVGGVTALAATLFSEISGRVMASRGSTFNSWSYGSQIVKDNVLTAHGWVMQVYDIVGTIMIGSAVGAIIWWVGMCAPKSRSGRP
jgi:hypothetical protein